MKHSANLEAAYVANNIFNHDHKEAEPPMAELRREIEALLRMNKHVVTKR